MLISMQEMMQDAIKRNYAVGSFATPSKEHVIGVISAAEELNAPVIIMIGILDMMNLDLDYIMPLMHKYARKAKVPVAVHLDHAKTLKAAVKGIQCGFNSIMFDRAEHPFEQNVAETKAFTDWAHLIGIAVEGEVGAMPSNVVGHGECSAYNEHITNIRDYFTKPEDVRPFVEQTGVDLLTVSFGTIHGPLFDPVDLDIELLKKLNAETDVALVMHGSSGTPDDQLLNSIKNGINKINFYTGMSHPVNKYMVELIEDKEGEPLFYHQVMEKVQDRIQEIARDRIALFSNGVKF